MTTKLHYLFWTFIFFSLFSNKGNSQILLSGFNKEEYSEMLKIAARQADTPWTNVRMPAPTQFKLAYRSPVAGLDNRWDLWLSDDSTAVISIRGTIGSAASWLENFYSAMVPATGSLQLTDSLKFEYKLAESSKASVHVGWLTAVGFLSSGIKEKINEYYPLGYHDFILTGHSQGGGITYLIRSYLEYEKQQRALPSGINFKTYCSAAPKPGNLYYTYDFDYLTRDGMAFNVVNQDDWVPETPFSIQQLSDFNSVNPLTDAKKKFQKTKTVCSSLP